MSVVAHYKLNENSGTNAPDSSGNGFNGTLVNMVDGDWVAGKLNNCLTFNDGNSEYVNCGDIADFERTDPFSVEAWINTGDVSNFILSRDLRSGTFRGWILRKLRRARFYLYFLL